MKTPSHFSKTSNKIKIQKWIYLCVFIIVFFVSCSKDSDNSEDSPANTQAEIEHISVDKAENPSFSDEAFVHTGKNNIYITLPPQADSTEVYLDFELSEGAELSIDNKLVEQKSGKFDLSETAEAEVTAESGAYKTYHILAQTGLKDLDELIYDFKEKYDIPGVSYAVMDMNKGEIVYKSGIGFSDKDELKRTDSNHLFRLGSISKQFTSIAIMRLIQDDKLGIDDQVFGRSGILEDEFDEVSNKAEKVTVRHLLDHTSGWETDPDPMFDVDFENQTLDERIEYVLDAPQPYEPGEFFDYFNMGYAILGKVIQKVSETNYETYLRSVLAKADIEDIWVGGGKLSDRRSNEVVYYPQDNLNAYPQDEEVEAAAGMVIASAVDLLKLITYIDGKDGPEDILDTETRDLMLSPSSNDDNYALGWRLNHPLFPGSWYHGGNLAGTATFWVLGPEYSTVLLCNSRSYKDGFDDDLYYITEGLIAIAEEQL